MTDNEITKALNTAADKDFVKVYLWNDKPPKITTISVAEIADLINRQKAEAEKQEAEIERLNYILQCYALEYGTVGDKERLLKVARAEAVKEFAERLKADKIKPEFPWDDFTVTEGMIDDLVKEFTEGKEDD